MVVDGGVVDIQGAVGHLPDTLTVEMVRVDALYVFEVWCVGSM